VRIEQRGVVKIKTRAKNIDVRKSNVTKVMLVFFTTSLPTFETVETRHDKAATTTATGMTVTGMAVKVMTAHISHLVL
jgi:hypothetical protein